MTKNEEKFYFSKFKNKVFVVKVGGEVIASQKILENILVDVLNLMKHGIKVIFVHGGGSQADDLAKKLGHSPIKIGGRRVTGEKDLEIVKMLYGGSLNLEILSILKKLGARGIRVSGLDAGLLDVKLRSKDKIDYGFVGDIVEVHGKVLLDLMKLGYLPVVSPLGVTDEGMILNINADTVATEIASNLKVEKLIMLTTADGIYDGKKLLKTLTIKEATALIEGGVISGGMIVKAENCIKAINDGVKRVHVINGMSPHSLVAEVVSKEGVGTMIISSHEKEKYLNE